MYLNGTNRNGLGQDDPITSALTWVSTPAASVGISPLWIAGLGLLGLAYALSGTRKLSRRVGRYRKQRSARKARIAAAKAALRAAKAS